jgi:hypothetical protein
VKAAGHPAEKDASKGIGGITAGAWKAVVKTRFSGSGSRGLKTPRVIERS